MVQDNIYLVPYADDPLQHLASDLLSDYSDHLPDLTEATVLLSESHTASSFRQILLEQAEQQNQYAILCPQILSLRNWASIQFHKFNQEPYTVCGQHQRELILFDVLTQHSSILGSGSPWNLTDDLLNLFDQLTLNQKTLVTNYDDFESQIATAYGLNPKDFPALGHEATLVHTLWHAWHTQLNAEKLLDKEAAYLLGLSADNSFNKSKLYIAGYHQFALAEQSWLKSLLQKQRCVLYIHGQAASNADNYHPDSPVTELLQTFNIDSLPDSNDPYTQFLNECFDNTNKTFIQRTSEFKHNSADSIKNRLKLLFTKSHEEQAHAVELQVRRWLLDGKQNIGIVTENRRLARRVRALLERADVNVQDYAGWALATTRAAAALERWFECIEEDFAFQPLLDLLKSPFIFSDLDSQEVKHATYRLEHDIIRHENIASNIQRYKRTINSRAQRLHWSSATSSLLISMLNRFDDAAALLNPLLNGRHPALKYIEQLSKSLEQLGMTALLKKDAAGCRVLEMLATLEHSATKYPLQFSWSDFRVWVGRSLEQFVFTPEMSSSAVSLIGLGQSRLQKFDALVIASAEYENFPGKTRQTPFFNNAVRKQLQLTTSHDLLNERFHHFRRLLESAPDIYITANSEDNGDEVPLSPWLEIIHRFYQQSFSASLEDDELKSLLSQPGSHVIRCTDKSLPHKTKQAVTSVPAGLLPKHYSPSSYQQLMDCPYQFFASICLKLVPSEEVQTALSKSDYGERVHRCLEAFHGEVESLPGPFKGILNAQNSEVAIKLLTEISNQVFNRDIKDNFEHRGWLEQWLNILPQYINWQIKRNSKWQVYKTEHRSHIKSENHLELVGRLDRIDESDAGLGIIDYKTGRSAKLGDIELGEAVQLPFYALLAEQDFQKPVSNVCYLNLGQNVRIGTELSDEALETISQQISLRLEKLHSAMKTGQPLTAWGDTKTCEYCNMRRLCRKQAWEI